MSATSLANFLADQLDGSREWTLKLLDSFTGEDWSFQPASGMAHALWLCGHITSSQNTLIHVRCLGQGILDESFTQHFPIGQPVATVTDHDYPTLESVLAKMSSVHQQTCDAVRGMSAELLAEAAPGAQGKPHPHYSDKAGAIAHCNRHEAFHAGQIATIRRLLDKPFLR